MPPLKCYPIRLTKGNGAVELPGASEAGLVAEAEFCRADWVGKNKVERLAGSFRWLLWLVLVVLVLCALALGLSVLNNNFAFSRPSRISFVKSLDHAVAASRDWTLRQFSFGDSGELMTTDLGAEFASNLALLHMLVDTAAISGDARLQQLSSKIVAGYRQSDVGLMGKLIDPAMRGPPAEHRGTGGIPTLVSARLLPSGVSFVGERAGGHVHSRQVQDVRRHSSAVRARPSIENSTATRPN